MSTEPSRVEIADTVSDLMYGIAGWLLIGLGVIGSLSGTGGVIQQAGTGDVMVPLFVLGVAILFINLGIYVNPRFRRRLDRRHGLSRFGRAKSVDRRILSPAENRRESCISCGSSLIKGLVRRYRQEYLIAGVPVWTTAKNHNFYCPSCAVKELSGPTSTDSATSDVTEQAIAEAE
jgi:hypothetical protein